MSANVEQMLAQKKLEMLTVSGFAETVVHADIMARNALESVLGIDTPEAWTLKNMQHQYAPEQRTKEGFHLLRSAGVEFTAEFVRKPDEEDES